ncbi:TPA: cell division FtsZ family protein [Vibrio parahaemolyticus]|nr:cell division FtsZ family protein [Vibrio parahaemolyticus]
MFFPEQLHRIAVVGIGCCGHNAINYLAPDLADDVDLWVFDTDARGMKSSERIKKFAIGSEVTNGLSAGAIPEVGEKGAEQDKHYITQSLQSYDLVFITGGLGGGTATGAIPLICDWLSETSAVTIAIVTMPFEFEGMKKSRFSQVALDKINIGADSTIVVANQKLLSTLPKSSTLISAFEASNQVLKRSLIGIYSLISTAGYINLDFADLRTMLHQAGPTVIGYGEGVGEGRIQKAIDAALDNPLLSDFDITTAKAVLINITADQSLGLGEIHSVGELLTEQIKGDIPIIIGNVITTTKQDDVKIYAIFSGVQSLALNNILKPRELWT